MARLICLTALLAAGPVLAETCTVPDGPGRPIDKAILYIEENTGDGDIGVHGSFDDHGWTELCLYNPAGELLLRVRPDAQMARLGMSELFFESQEPEYAAFDFADLKAAWPQGNYTVRAQSHDGEILTGAALFTHDLPTPPLITAPAGLAAEREGARWRAAVATQVSGLSRAIATQFQSWGLTDAQADVAGLLIKGLSQREIATLRHCSEATVRQHATTIYSKSGLANRAQLTAFFLEDLLPGPSPQAARELVHD